MSFLHAIKTFINGGNVEEPETMDDIANQIKKEIKEMENKFKEMSDGEKKKKFAKELEKKKRELARVLVCKDRQESAQTKFEEKVANGDLPKKKKKTSGGGSQKTTPVQVKEQKSVAKDVKKEKGEMEIGD